MALNAPLKRLFRSTDPKREKTIYSSPGYDLGIGRHDLYTCDGHEIDAIYCNGRGVRYLVVARKPNSKKRYVGFEYNLNTGQSKYFDYSVSQKDIDKMVASMDLFKENKW